MHKQRGTFQNFAFSQSFNNNLSCKRGHPLEFILRGNFVQNTVEWPKEELETSISALQAWLAGLAH